jgi:hypothetical protein
MSPLIKIHYRASLSKIYEVTMSECSAKSPVEKSNPHRGAEQIGIGTAIDDHTNRVLP